MSVVMNVQSNKPGKQSLRVQNWHLIILVYFLKVAAKNKQRRGKTLTHNLLACVPFGTGMKRDQLKSAILVSQVPEDFFTRVKLGSLRVHVVSSFGNS